MMSAMADSKVYPMDLIEPIRESALGIFFLVLTILHFLLYRSINSYFSSCTIDFLSSLLCNLHGVFILSSISNVSSTSHLRGYKPTFGFKVQGSRVIYATNFTSYLFSSDLASFRRHSGSCRIPRGYAGGRCQPAAAPCTGQPSLETCCGLRQSEQPPCRHLYRG